MIEYADKCPLSTRWTFSAKSFVKSNSLTLNISFQFQRKMKVKTYTYVYCIYYFPYILPKVIEIEKIKIILSFGRINTTIVKWLISLTCFLNTFMY